MSVRSLVAVVALTLLTPSLAFAVENGKAEGTITINRKAVKLKYAFAKKEKDSDEKEHWVVILTDRAVSRSVLADDSRLNKVVENGQAVAAVFRFDEGKQLEGVEIKSKALQHKSLTMDVSEVTVKGLTFTADAIEAGATTTADQSSFTDVATIDVKFRGMLGKDGKFGDNASAATELAASGPKLIDGGAIGTLTVDGSSVKLTHSLARSQPGTFDEKKTEWVVLLSDRPVAAEMFGDTSKLMSAVNEGALQGLVLTVNPDEIPYHLRFLHPKTSMQVSGSGFWNLDVTDFSDKRIAARFYTTEVRDMGDHKYSYDVSFATPVEVTVAPKEMTVDASSGTKLPANGGEPGKAYSAFDKASRAGDLASMKKYASKTGPLPEMDAEELKQMLEIMKALRPVKVKITGGFASTDHASLSVEAENPFDKKKRNGTIEMAREDGAWKILNEKWKN